MCGNKQSEIAVWCCNFKVALTPLSDKLKAFLKFYQLLRITFLNSKLKLTEFAAGCIEDDCVAPNPPKLMLVFGADPPKLKGDADAGFEAGPNENPCCKELLLDVALKENGFAGSALDPPKEAEDTPKVCVMWPVVDDDTADPGLPPKENKACGAALWTNGAEAVDAVEVALTEGTVKLKAATEEAVTGAALLAANWKGVDPEDEVAGTTLGVKLKEGTAGADVVGAEEEKPPFEAESAPNENVEFDSAVAGPSLLDGTTVWPIPKAKDDACPDGAAKENPDVEGLLGGKNPVEGSGETKSIIGNRITICTQMSNLLGNEPMLSIMFLKNSIVQNESWNSEVYRNLIEKQRNQPKGTMKILLMNIPNNLFCSYSCYKEH